MKNKKNIERLFQEKFKEFEILPPEDVWENISEKLHPKKKKRRVIPFWIRVSGIAATLSLGFFIFNNNFYADNTELTLEENRKTLFEQDKTNLLKPVESPIVEYQIITEEQKQVDLPVEQENINSIKTSIEKENSVIVQSPQKSKSKLKDLPFKNNQKVEQIALSENFDKGSFEIKKSNSPFSEIESFDMQEKLSESNGNLKHSEFQFSEQKTKIALQENEGIAITEEKQPEVNELVELLAQMKEDEEKEKEKEKNHEYTKWKITPNIAPITMNSLSEGSPVSEQFIENTKDYRTSVSVGLGFNYALSEKVSIRTGVNKFLVGYNTNDIAIYASADVKDVLANNVNIDFSDNANNIVLKPESLFIINNEGTSQNFGHINQKIGFIEIPMEVSYKILDKKFNIEIIGGMSTLFLQENEVSVISNGMKADLGEANNLNDVHFSTNLGLGFRYEIFKSFEASVEPMFKYQIGTFSRNDGNFKPYILGLYTGLSFKF